MHDELTIYRVRADSGELGCDGYLKIAGYHELLCRILEADMSAHGHTLSDTLRSGYAWAMVSLSMQVDKPIQSCGLHFAQTWLSELRYPHLRREIEIFSENNERLVSASVFMVPLSITTHKIQPEDQLIKCDFPVYPELSVCWAQPRMQVIYDERYLPLDSRTVHPSDIDALGHLNNCRYGAYVYDALSSLGKDVASAPFRYTLHFMRQCAVGTQLNIGSYEENGAVHLIGIGRQDRLKRFCAIVDNLK